MILSTVMPVTKGLATNLFEPNCLYIGCACWRLIRWDQICLPNRTTDLRRRRRRNWAVKDDICQCLNMLPGTVSGCLQAN
ncbi:hypothetical protein CRM22_004248 [Opisthorchis felineus]|uniref:Uncharacterized protein n=1 Tax=Opisthorchis felineus TaxID=147828 RepID=A0A4S2M2E0_OPIFE|nr:hypothetical protein CRM22_004248 [Opisthorchis felineus]